MNNDLNFKEIGIRIQMHRINNKMTQEQLAEQIGTTQKYLSRIEGGNHNLHLNTVVAIARALNIPVDSLIADPRNSNDESTIAIITDKIRGMTPKQLEMLNDLIEAIKKYDF